MSIVMSHKLSQHNYICTCMCAHTYTLMHAYKSAHAHTHTHIHAQDQTSMRGKAFSKLSSILRIELPL